MDLDGNEVVAEGRWETREPNTLVNGLPIGPNAVKVFVDEVIKADTFLWRPTSEIKYMEDSLKTFIAWPAKSVVFGTTIDETASPKSPIEISEASEPSPPKKSKKPVLSPTRRSRRNNPDQVDKENQKCKLIDCTVKTKKVVAIGRWSTNNPEQPVHCIPLGPNAVRVWVDVVKVKDAAVWRKTSEIECMEDAFGSTIAWPEDKVVMC